MYIGVEYLSISLFRKLLSEGSLEQIICKFKSGHAIVIEGSLSPIEKSMLVEEIMKNIDVNFFGIELFELTLPGKIGRRKRLLTIMAPKLRLVNFRVYEGRENYGIICELKTSFFPEGAF